MLAKPPLKLYLLGSFRLDGEKDSILVPSRKAQLLLAYLALHPGAHSREKLAYLFWGDSSDVQARESFRTALKLLRKYVGVDALLADRETAQINPDFPLWVDANEFKEEIRRMKDEARRFILHPFTPFRTSSSSLNLYSGDLLQDFYDDWILPERERYRELYLGALLQLTQAARAASEYERAMEYAHQVLAADPANERAHQHLMFCNLALGNRNATLQQYAACVRALQTELAVEPSRETTALYHWIKQAPLERPSLAAQITNLPIPLSSFIGRKLQLTQLKQSLTTTRLLTLTGAGGSGKTRLAIQVATDLIDQFYDGVWWVDLAPRIAETLVPQAVAQALRVRDDAPTQVRDSTRELDSNALRDHASAVPDEQLIASLINFLREKQLLLVLDNCEHLITGTAQLVDALLTHCPNLQILATSREAFAITGESVYQVPTLALPSSQHLRLADFLMEYEGIRLFVERARSLHSDFALTEQNAAAVLEICQRLDGIPLALELAAARCKLLTVEQIVERLHDRFHLLTQGSRTALPRHQTLRATIDWSYNLLTQAERSLFRRVSIFVGGFTLNAAQVVCSGMDLQVLDELSHLVDKSLVIADRQEVETRYRLLETIRQYAAERLDETGETNTFRHRHCDYFCQLAEHAHLEEHKPTAAMRFDELAREYDNLRVVLDWLLDQGDGVKALRLACVLNYFWQVRGHWSEGRTWIERALAKANYESKTVSDQEISLWAQALRCLGVLAVSQRDLNAARASLAKSIELYRNLARARMLDADEKAGLGAALNYMGFAAFYQSDYARATTLFQEALVLYQELGDVGVGFTLSMLARAALLRGEYERAAQLGEESVALGRHLQHLHLTAAALDVTGRASYAQGDFERARLLLEESLVLSQVLDYQQDVADTLNTLGLVAFYQGEYRKATEWLAEGLVLSQTIKYSMGQACSLSTLSEVSLAENDPTRARASLVQSLALFRQLEMQWHITRGVEIMSAIAAAEGEFARAARLFGVASAMREAMGVPLLPPDRPAYHRAIELTRAQLGGETFAAAWDEGVLHQQSSQGVDEAIEYALRKM